MPPQQPTDTPPQDPAVQSLPTPPSPATPVTPSAPEPQLNEVDDSLPPISTPDTDPLDAFDSPNATQPPEESKSPTPFAPPVSITPPVSNEPSPTEPSFEPTPEEIPSYQPSTSATVIAEEENLVKANEAIIEKQTTTPEIQPEPVIESQEPAPQPETPATLPPKSGSPIVPVIIVVLLLIAGVGVAASAYLSQQTSKLKSQLSDITQTLEKQKTTLTPTPTPSVFEIPTPTTTATISAATTPAVSPSSAPTTAASTDSLTPLANATLALSTAISRSPNAQLILIKVDNAGDPTTAVTKYFFREDLTTKKYFYVAITGKGQPEIIDKQIYVTPDDNIPSLNDAVLGNKMGIELDQALTLTYVLCANHATCTSSPIKAQYVKTGTGIIWQISVYSKGISASPLIAQINAETKAIIYKSEGFATLAP